MYSSSCGLTRKCPANFNSSYTKTSSVEENKAIDDDHVIAVVLVETPHCACYCEIYRAGSYL